ncbi:hypothetical protein ACHAXA_007067, partial [Cyclostephanos tholiformis]
FAGVTTTTTNGSPISIDDLPRGIPGGSHRIIESRAVPTGGFSISSMHDAFGIDDIDRLGLRPDDLTVPAALLLLFPDQFVTLTRARKECRRRRILIVRGNRVDHDDAAIRDDGEGGGGGRRMRERTRMVHDNYSECRNHHDDAPFPLPVIYEDDHLAIVNKPEGIVVFSHKGGDFGRNSVKSCLPWVLTPPTSGVFSVMRRPCPVHRIDRGTSGLLVCAKTKPAMVELSRLFKERRVKKTYTAIVNGDIQEPAETSITSEQAKGLGVCTGIDAYDTNPRDAHWQIIDKDLDDQSAVTIWRVVRKMRLENARNDTVSMVELKPKTGRYHQLRRHMAWVSQCPLLGDKLYDGGGLAKTLRDKGFYLCSNRVTLEHPFYNTPQGRSEWATKRQALLGVKGECNRVSITEEDGVILIHCEIDLPSKFQDFLPRVEGEMQTITEGPS